MTTRGTNESVSGVVKPGFSGNSLGSDGPSDTLVAPVHPRVGVLEVSDDKGIQGDEAFFDETAF